MGTIYAPAAVTCSECGFTTRDLHLIGNHSCDVQANGGRCEDWPCCGHAQGDCNGLLYGSNEAIKARVQHEWDTGHGYCDHEAGLFNCSDEGEEEDETETCPGCGGEMDSDQHHCDDCLNDVFQENPGDDLYDDEPYDEGAMGRFL